MPTPGSAEVRGERENAKARVHLQLRQPLVCPKAVGRYKASAKSSAQTLTNTIAVTISRDLKRFCTAAFELTASGSFRIPIGGINGTTAE